MLPIAILAGGLATRLRPITTTIPKSLVEVAGRPFIEWQLDYLHGQGIHEVVMCVGYLGEKIEALVGNGAKYGVHIEYSFDGPKLLGTGGALRKALPLLGDAFFVFYGDSYLPIDFLVVQTSYRHQQLPALMTVLRNDDQWDASNVIYREGRLIEYNKREARSDMNFIDYGLGVLSSNILMSHKEDEVFELADVYHDLSIQGSLAGLEVHERFYEIGSHQGLQETAEYLLAERN
jgi:N-acetyl-alpha-D-muramate 1-phosphate uridylyltransferase